VYSFSWLIRPAGIEYSRRSPREVKEELVAASPPLPSNLSSDTVRALHEVNSAFRETVLEEIPAVMEARPSLSVNRSLYSYATTATAEVHFVLSNSRDGVEHMDKHRRRRRRRSSSALRMGFGWHSVVDRSQRETERRLAEFRERTRYLDEGRRKQKQERLQQIMSQYSASLSAPVSPTASTGSEFVPLAQYILLFRRHHFDVLMQKGKEQRLLPPPLHPLHPPCPPLHSSSSRQTL
jgi:hypothetical protein